MLIMRNKIVISIVFCFLALSAAAQNLDPTVEVSREYEGKLVEVHKPVFKMAVPDSLTRFALDFDYFVHDNPYKGSYEFNPYLLSMKPSASDNGEHRFFLKAGAGYQLHPTLDLIWSPGFERKGFNMDVYGMHRSFVGNYLPVSPDDQQGFVYDLLSKAGVVLKHDWEKVALDYSAGYYGMAQKDRLWKRMYNAADASVGIHTKPASRENLRFDMELDYRFGEDVVGDSKLHENLGTLKMQLSQMWKSAQSMNLGLEANVASYGSAFDLLAGDVALTPSYVYNNERFSANLGLRISKMLTRKDVNEQYVYPDVSVSYFLLPRSLRVYFNAAGGGAFDSYSSTIAANHHVTHLMSPDILGYTVERVGVTAGFDGRVTDKFTYDIRAGYVNYANYRHYTVDAALSSFSMTYLDAQKLFACIDWALDVEGFRFDGTVSYDHYLPGNYGDVSSGHIVLKPVALTGHSAVEYKWRNRIVCGVEADFSTARRGAGVMIPGYVDLGAYAEYATARGISFWVSAGNLLNQTVQKTPLYAEKGVYFTAGICLNL